MKRSNGWVIDPRNWLTPAIKYGTFPTLQDFISVLKKYNLVGDGLTPEQVSAKVGGMGATELKRTITRGHVRKLSQMSEYKGMLEIMVVDKKVTPTEYDRLAQWRAENGLNFDDHEHVLSEIGLSTAAFQAMRETSNEHLCLVCLEGTKQVFLVLLPSCQVVFIPCGHMVTCVTCGPRLTACCVCRAKIGNSITIDNNT